MLRLAARGKINWTLDILGRRKDGYHLMDMLMSSVELADLLTVEPADELTLTMIGKEDLNVSDNLVLRAARSLQNAVDCKAGASLTLSKRLPVGAGMGGGSADAAAALIGLNRLWNANCDAETLASVGLSVGADVPFLLTGGFARVGGIGESIRSLPAPASVPLVILQPAKPLSTPDVFSAYDRLTSVRHPNTDQAQSALTAGNLAAVAASAGNVLQQAVESGQPQIEEALAALEACGAAYATMTGSGSAVFGAFENENEAKAAFRLLRKRWRKCWLTSTADRGVEFLP